MTIADVERRLRLPAPDEPAHLPPLVLPAESPWGARSVAGRVRVGRAVPAMGFASPRLAAALLALLIALAAAIGTGALRLDGLLSSDDPIAEYDGRGLELTYPGDWRRLTPNDPFDGSGASTALIVTNSATTGCDDSELPAPNQAYPSGEPSPAADDRLGREDRLLACLVDKPMAPGEIRVAVSQGMPQLVGVGFIEPFDYTDWFGPEADPAQLHFYLPSEADGWTEEIDGMPAKRLVATDSIVPGAEETVTWAVYTPERLDAHWFVRATLRGPGLDELRAEVDAIARSLRFDTRPVALTDDESTVALAAGIDSVDREARRWPGTDFFGCFPREAGERTVQLEHGPSGPLLRPVTVSCRTTVEATPVHVWHAQLVASWASGGGAEAGEWRMDLYITSDGTVTGQARDLKNETTVFPGTTGELPPPLSGPLVLPIGSIVAVLPPGIDDSLPPIQAHYQAPLARIGESELVWEAPAGTRLVIVEGPVEHQGTDWYLVQWTHGTSYPSVVAWTPATSDGRPLLEVVQPRCPEGEVTVPELLRLIPAERVECFGDRELVLERVVATEEAAEQGAAVIGTPEWLAPDTRWRLWGPEGPAGLEGSLPVAVAPSLASGALPTGKPLTVHGHFDDPASATCERQVPEEWSVPPEPPAVHVMRCQQLFVVTAVEEVVP